MSRFVCGERLLLFIATLCLFNGAPQLAWAWNQLPLRVESPQTLPFGTCQLHFGVRYLKQKNFPFSPFSSDYDRDVLSVPAVGLRIGLGTRTELHLTYEVLCIEEEEFQIREVWESGDLAFFTKIRVLNESRTLPGLGITFGSKLPNAGDDKRIGTDETDLAFLASSEKTFSAFTVTSHLGLLILGNPFENARQDDLLAYGLAIKIPWNEQFSFTSEFAGQTFGTDHNENASVLLHVHFYDHHLTWKLAGRVGLLNNSEKWGLSGGVSVTIGP